MSTDDEYDPFAALEGSLDLERSVNADLSDADLADKIIAQGAPGAAQELVRLATGASNENTRVRAATYIVDRVCGAKSGTSGDDMYEQLFSKIAKESSSK